MEICDCGSENITTALENVRPHGPRLVSTCGDCGRAAITTDPTPAERIVTTLLAARAG